MKALFNPQMITHKQIDALELDPELKLKHGETRKTKWLHRMYERGQTTWKIKKKTGVTLNVAKVSK